MFEITLVRLWSFSDDGWVGLDVVWTLKSTTALSTRSTLKGPVGCYAAYLQRGRLGVKWRGSDDDGAPRPSHGSRVPNVGERR